MWFEPGSFIEGDTGTIASKPGRAVMGDPRGKGQVYGSGIDVPQLCLKTGATPDYHSPRFSPGGANDHSVIMAVSELARPDTALTTRPRPPKA